jgi:ATP-dependent DNA ligase
VEAFADGKQLLDAANRHGLEGAVSKRKAAPYRSRPPHLSQAILDAKGKRNGSL